MDLNIKKKYYLKIDTVETLRVVIYMHYKMKMKAMKKMILTIYWHWICIRKEFRKWCSSGWASKQWADSRD